MFEPEVTVYDGEPPTLEEAQAVVGGYVEMLTMPNGDQLLVNEDGLRQKLPVNTDATLIASGSAFQVIVGPAALLKGTARWT